MPQGRISTKDPSVTKKSWAKTTTMMSFRMMSFITRSRRCHCAWKSTTSTKSRLRCLTHRNVFRSRTFTNAIVQTSIHTILQRKTTLSPKMPAATLWINPLLTPSLIHKPNTSTKPSHNATRSFQFNCKTNELRTSIFRKCSQSSSIRMRCKNNNLQRWRKNMKGKLKG